MEDVGKRCGNCGHSMEYVNTEKIQLGKYSTIFGHWPNLLAGALSVDIWSCPNCRKLDFYWCDLAEDGFEYQDDENRMAQTTCPCCGQVHDLDDPKCPRCGAKNPNI